MSAKTESSKSAKIRPYDLIGIGAGWLAMMVAGGIYAFLATLLMSAVPIYVIIPVGLLLSAGALVGTMEYFFKLDREQHRRTGYRYVSMPYGL